MFKRILIANRGEIARRIQQTCQRLGVETVAVYSDADAAAGFVAAADQAVRIGRAPASESYLDIERIVQAAKDSGAQAVHPGYGFLAENAAFAQAVTDAGLTFVGPTADSIALMGSKIAAKRTMEKAGVPCIPGYHGDEQDDATLTREAERIGFPVLVKASAGGGGKGMRVVRDAKDFAAACASARREARSAFGDDRLLLEKFIDRPRHIEVQVFGDGKGQVLHLFERECSVQRRYQKIIEEAPSPAVDEALRARITAAAVKAAQAVDYLNAGTIEFILADDGAFYFMEMNTRLQVEHPVTEMITGHDLVEWQLRVASGEGLPCRQDALGIDGHAIEVRVYAENPYADFLPSTGLIEAFDVPATDSLRIDADLRAGQSVSVHYDPMIAKLSLHAANRAEAAAQLAEALDRVALFGPATNLPLLRTLLRHEDFTGARIDTGYIDRHLDELVAAPDSLPRQALLVASLAEYRRAAANGAPWSADGWQANGRGVRRFGWRFADGRSTQTSIAARDGELLAAIGDESSVVARLELSGSEVTAQLDGHALAAQISSFGPWRQVQVGGERHEFQLAPLYASGGGGAADAGHPGAPMPGRIVKLHVAPGDRVEAGQPLVVLEGMKMEFTVKAAMSGVVDAVLCAEGEQVDAEVPLVDLRSE